METKKKIVKVDDYQFLSILGAGNSVLKAGSFGKVKLVKHKKEDKYGCVKIMKKEDIIKAKQADHMIN